MELVEASELEISGRPAEVHVMKNPAPAEHPPVFF
jgi:hypothetical protein